ncbi:MAG: metalloregulator ArsR/SmtB family transcription factor [Rhodococcus sp. (in: high G+C Gram-positive bacteria)]|uniref:ArsR/SmtB family transcription factor n=1 Tax=Rhodococcus sp. TaxID=1831 RepID=UPI003BB606C3
MDEDTVFRALADPTRRRLLDSLRARPGQTLGELCDGLDIRRQSVSKHLELLEDANLVATIRDGRRKLHYLNPVPVHEIRKRWISKFDEPQVLALDAITRRAEEIAMTPTTAHTVPDYVYTTYIRATPEEVWHALTDPDLTARYWGHAQVSEWTPGSRIEHVRTDGSGIADCAGRVIEADPPRRLVFGFDDASLADDPDFEPSVVTFEIDAHQDIVKLTVLHRKLRNADDRNSIGQGWPAVLANLKTLLETGEVLPQAPWEFHADDRAARMAPNA